MQVNPAVVVMRMQLITAAVHMRALLDWLLDNHENLEQPTLNWFSAYMLEIARYAGVVADIMDGKPVAGRRCIFY